MTILKYIIENNPTVEDDSVIRNGIINFNSQIIHEKATHFSIYVQANTEIIAGALVWQHSDALYIDVLWCNENYRKKGISTKIILMIEEGATNKQLLKIFVDTYTFQAQAFYQKQGFHCIGTLPKYLLGHDRIFMRKDFL